jgi:hypothetical protein
MTSESWFAIDSDDSPLRNRKITTVVLGIPTPALLAKAVEKLDAVPMDDRDTKGDVYEYMLGNIKRQILSSRSTAGIVAKLRGASRGRAQIEQAPTAP